MVSFLKKCFDAIPNARRRLQFGELFTHFIFGKLLLVVIHFAWILVYPPNEDYECWDQQHWTLLLLWPTCALILSALVQLIVYSMEQSQKMILYGFSANAMLYLSQTLHMSTRFLPECFSLNFLSFLFGVIGVVLFFLESRQFFLLTKEV